MTLEELYRTHYKHFIYKIYPYLHSYDIAEEVVQDAFIKAFTKFDTYDPEKGQIKNWFHSLLFSVLWGHKRAMKKTICSNNPEGLEHIIDINRDSLLLFDNIENLFHKKILTTYFVLGYTYGETAEVCNVGKHNVKKIVQRFKKQFVLGV